ncbi:hypothetical protein [Pseudodesulfovibrio tunisiensis]|uniref:hypothetical protein n=1 Tax=Pseudodesulfovibrio tunisiensis TaxID=463192 RepID=UPI001FB3FE83|nr:hypothetical protein [Pseudodesulfovibrio tunisiensis]
MAVVKILVKQDWPASRHSETTCKYSISPDNKMLQIDTFGSRNREIVGKKSQSIRFTQEALQELKSILNKMDI